MFNNLIDNIKNKINTLKTENENYNIQLNNSKKFTNLSPLPNLTSTIIESKILNILNECPDINKDKATIISKLIPLNETYLTIAYTKEIITNIEYWLIPTNKQIWIINNNSYGIIPYESIRKLTIVKNNLMSKIINLNDIILEINGNDIKINNFISILTNPNTKELITKEKTSYLCGIIPIYQNINNINSGISIDNYANIVFHTKTNNYKYNKEDILNYELLLDNNPIINKNQTTNNHITTFTNSCYTINIRITTKDNQFIIPILESSPTGYKYTIKDTIFITNINFAKEIIKKLNELYKDTYLP